MPVPRKEVAWLKTTLAIALSFAIAVCLCPARSTAESGASGMDAAARFTYEHDPRENPIAMRDIVENPDAIYGFSPSLAEDSTLKEYATSIDWTDPAQVEEARKAQQAYHDSMEELYDIIFAMVVEDQDIEIIARTISQRRNELRLASEADDPEGLERVKKRNLEVYGNELGPTQDALYEKYGSWEMVLTKALGTNPGMDACLGLYDEYYELYVIEGEVVIESGDMSDVVFVDEEPLALPGTGDPGPDESEAKGNAG